MLVIPAIASLTAANYTGQERALAFGMLGGIAGAGVAAGPLIGGFVTSAWTWRLVFAGETVVVIAILALRRAQDPRRTAGPSASRWTWSAPGCRRSASAWPSSGSSRAARGA